MANGVNNISKGRGVEQYFRVDSASDTPNAQYIIVLCTGAATDEDLKDAETLQALLATAANESTDGNYTRKRVQRTDVGWTPFASTGPDHGLNRWDLPMIDQSWAGMSGESLTRLIVCYDPTGSGQTPGANDANVIPVTFHDFTITTNGSELQANFSPQGFYGAGE